jgi:CrcB protein
MKCIMTLSGQTSNLWASAAAVGAGASIGGLLRWRLGEWLNGLHPDVPPGTLLVNVVGGLLMGVALGFASRHPEWAPHWRLFLTTGFLGGFTTFSTFSGEVVALLMQDKLLPALLASTLHLAGSVAATAIGLAVFQALTSPR